MMLPVLLGISFVIFTMMYFTPGDPARMLLGERAEESVVEELREEMGLNEPFLVRYGTYIKGIVTEGDFGISYLPSGRFWKKFSTVFPQHCCWLR